MKTMFVTNESVPCIPLRCRDIYNLFEFAYVWTMTTSGVAQSLDSQDEKWLVWIWPVKTPLQSTSGNLAAVELGNFGYAETTDLDASYTNLPYFGY